jgi:maleylacetoacetate isomerase
VRWALAHKEISCQFVAVDLLKNEQHEAEHLARSPLGNVPALKIEDGTKSIYLTESLAIIEWLEEAYPQSTKLLGHGALERAHIRELALLIACDVQPIQNLSVQKKVSDDSEVKKKWAQYWIRRGLSAYEILCKKTSGQFSVGNNLTLADVVLIPQCYNALRFEVDLNEFPIIASIESHCRQLKSYAVAHPDYFKPEGN